jgi:hypothetical protein
MIADQYNVHRTTISNIIRGTTWKSPYTERKGKIQSSRESHPALLGKGHRAKLPWLQVQEIRKRHGQGESQSFLAREFGISQPQVSRIVRGELRKDR